MRFPEGEEFARIPGIEGREPVIQDLGGGRLRTRYARGQQNGKEHQEKLSQHELCIQIYFIIDQSDIAYIYYFNYEYYRS